MYIKEYLIDTWHIRKSKLGKPHSYCRKKTMVILRCDNCDAEFVRPRGSMNPKRLNNNYFHVCENCDAKVFAQKRGVDSKKVWLLNASSNIPIGKI